MAPSRRALLLSLTITILCVCSPASAAAQITTPAKPAAQVTPPPAVDLRKAVQKALDKRWKTWKLAPLTCGTDGQPGAAAANTVGDYNSDGQPDAVFAVTTDKGSFLVVAINRIADVDLYEVDSLPADGVVSVQLRKRGTKYFRKDLPFDQYFGADALTVTPCGGSGDVTAYLFTGSGFRREMIALAEAR